MTRTLELSSIVPDSVSLIRICFLQEVSPHLPLSQDLCKLNSKLMVVGQTVLVANPCDRTITQQNADGTWTFIIPRGLNGGSVIGGSKEPNDWNPDPVMSTRNEILRRAAKMYPPIISNGRPPTYGGFEILADVVGRRPTRRGGVRIERED